MFENEIWTPPLSSMDQKRLNRQRWRRWQKVAKWTGFSDKTLWDWLQLLAALAIPVVIAAGTLWFSAQQNEASSQAAKDQHDIDLQIAKDQQEETALQTYLDRMSDLLLNHNLHGSKDGDEVRNVAQARTLTILPQLDSIRKGEVIRFLQDAGLIDQRDTIIDLSNTDLSYIDLKGANLSYANLSGTNLNHANLSYPTELSNANLSGANLSYINLHESLLQQTNLDFANLEYADLSQARAEDSDFRKTNLSSANLRQIQLERSILFGAHMSGTNLFIADLHDADLRFADLSKSDLRGADLSGAKLSGANLSKSDLRGVDRDYTDLVGVDPSGTNLSGADLSDANLSGVRIPKDHLKTAKHTDSRHPIHIWAVNDGRCVILSDQADYLSLTSF